MEINFGRGGELPKRKVAKSVSSDKHCRCQQELIQVYINFSVKMTTEQKTMRMKNQNKSS